MARSTVAVRFTGDAADLKRSIGDVDGRLGKFGSGLASFGKTAAIGLGAVAVGAVAMGKSFVDAAYESQKITAQTAAVIESMGGVANVTAKQVAKLSEKLSMQTGVDDELIQSGQNVLLTFGNVRNAVGKGPKVFDRATKAALDMSVALGTDMSSASMMVGKALNDPIDGLAKLSRSGIQFTDQQKEQIKTMQEAGDIAGAQAVMLEELERQFGGSAEAQATASDKLKVAWGNVQEELGARLIPVLEKVATWLADHLPAAVDRALPILENIAVFFGNVGSAIATFVEEAKPEVERFVTEALAALKQWWDANGPTVIAAVNGLKDAIVVAFQAAIEAGQFVIEHWDQFKVLAGVMVAAVIGHYVALAAAAVASAATQAGAWVSMKLAAIASKIETAAIVALMIADWVALAAKAVFHAAVVAGAWVTTQLAAIRASAITIGAATAQGGAWAGLAATAETQAARIARAWAAALGAAGAVIAAAETINNLTGQKLNPNKLSLWERLDPRKAFDGMSFSLPGFDTGGIVPGPKGSPQMVLAHGGETILPTHKQSMGGGLVVNLNVSVDRTMDPGQVGKQLVEAISAYERRSGTGWRS